MPTSFTLDCHGLTDIGLVREKNEDQFLVADLRKSLDVQASSLPLEGRRWLTGDAQAKLLLVADGMGGMGSGDRASRIVVNTLVRYAVHTMDWIRPDEPADEKDLLADLLDALARCQRRLERLAERDPSVRGMGTTLTLGYIAGATLYVIHIGDSRCYLRRGEDIRQVTTDHTVAEQLLREGALTESQAETSRWKHALWQALTASEDQTDIRPDILRIELKPGDDVLFCSDGLNKHVSDERILEILDVAPDAREACESLRDEALADGGKDNVTVVVARCQAQGAPA